MTKQRFTIVVAILGIAITAAIVAFPPSKSSLRATTDAKSASGASLAAGMPRVRDLAALPLPSADAIFDAVRATEPVSVDGAQQVAALTDSVETAAVQHVSEALWYRFAQRDLNAYLKWRTEYGYRGLSQQRLSVDSSFRSDLLRHAGLAPEASVPADALERIWERWALSKSTMASISKSSDDHQIIRGRLLQPTKSHLVSGLLAPFPSLLKSSSTASPALRGLFSGRWGVGWPFWIPPADVLARLGEPGTDLREVIVTLGAAAGADGKVEHWSTIGVLVAYDQISKKWWIVQHYMYEFHTSGASLTGVFF
jgi:hypothetical protein